MWAVDAKKSASRKHEVLRDPVHLVSFRLTHDINHAPADVIVFITCRCFTNSSLEPVEHPNTRLPSVSNKVSSNETNTRQSWVKRSDLNTISS